MLQITNPPPNAESFQVQVPQHQAQPTEQADQATTIHQDKSP